MAEFIRFRPYSEDTRQSLGGHVSYDVAMGNRMPEATVNALTLLIGMVIGDDLSGEFKDVMTRFEQALSDRIESGENITDFQLTVAPYIPGIGFCPLAVPVPE